MHQPVGDASRGRRVLCVPDGCARDGEGSRVKYENVKTEAVLTLQEKTGHWDVSGIELHISSHRPEREAAKFQKAAKIAKGRCPISRALNVPIKMIAALVQKGAQSSQAEATGIPVCAVVSSAARAHG